MFNLVRVQRTSRTVASTRGQMPKGEEPTQSTRYADNVCLQCVLKIVQCTILSTLGFVCTPIAADCTMWCEIKKYVSSHVYLGLCKAAGSVAFSCSPPGTAARGSLGRGPRGGRIECKCKSAPLCRREASGAPLRVCPAALDPIAARDAAGGYPAAHDGLLGARYGTLVGHPRVTSQKCGQHAPTHAAPSMRPRMRVR
jgi:hypothetical protein